jgi:hypothetical protein
MFRLFGITDAKNLKQFHGRDGITPRLSGFYLVIGYRAVFFKRILPGDRNPDDG